MLTTAKERVYEKRIATLTLGSNAFIYGGVGSYLYSLCDLCERAGIWLDIFTDRTIQKRRSKVPIELYFKFAPHSKAIDIRHSILRSRRATYPALKDAFTVNTFFAHSQSIIYDCIIFNEVGMLASAIDSGLVHPNLYVYLHQHELFVQGGSYALLPNWLVSIYRTMLKELKYAGLLTQCSENKPLIVEQLGMDNTHVMPITLPDYEPDYAGFEQREGISYVGSGERLKNPEQAIAVFNLIPDCPKVYFYVGRGIARLKKQLKGADFEWQIREKLPRQQLIAELKKRRVAVHTATMEGFGLAILEQMHFMPVLLPREAEYSSHFPSAVLFSDPQEGAQLLFAAYSDETRWQQITHMNHAYITEQFDADKIAGRYAHLATVEPKQSVSGDRVSAMVEEQPMRYDHVLKKMNWLDTVASIQYAVQWPVKRFHTTKATYLAPAEWSLAQFKEWSNSNAIHTAS